MRTSWGEIAVADAHVHFFSHTFFSMLAAQRNSGPGLDTDAAAAEVTATLGWEAPPEEPEHLAAVWTEELDRRGVEKAALIASLPGDERSVAKAAAKFPERFYGYFMVNPLSPEALDRVEGALSAGLQGICFFPAMHRYSMDDARVEPILEAAA